MLEIRCIAGFFEKLNIYDFSSSQRKFPKICFFRITVKYIGRSIEAVITGLTRNQFVGNSGTWVRIPPCPPIGASFLVPIFLFMICFVCIYFKCSVYLLCKNNSHKLMGKCDFSKAYAFICLFFYCF